MSDTNDEKKTEDAPAEPTPAATEPDATAGGESPSLTPSPPPKKGGYIVSAWLVILLALGFGAGLAGVHVGLADTIAANQLNEALSQVPVLVPGAEDGERVTTENGTTYYRALDAGGAVVGYVLSAKGSGFADTIKVLVGFDAGATTITGVYVLEQKETPALGDRIRNPEWRAQFEGMPTGTPVGVVKQPPDKTPTDIVALSGATVSSMAVTGIVNQAARQMRAILAADTAGSSGGEE